MLYRIDLYTLQYFLIKFNCVSFYASLKINHTHTNQDGDIRPLMFRSAAPLEDDNDHELKSIKKRARDRSQKLTPL